MGWLPLPGWHSHDPPLAGKNDASQIAVMGLVSHDCACADFMLRPQQAHASRAARAILLLKILGTMNLLPRGARFVLGGVLELTKSNSDIPLRPDRRTSDRSSGTRISVVTGRSTL